MADPAANPVLAPQAPAAPPPAPIQPNPAPQPQHGHLRLPRQALAIPALKSVHSLTFGRLDSDFHTLDHTVNIAAQASLPELVFRQMEQLTSVDFPLTQVDFIRMWQTLILKRTQDVIEKQRLQRPDHFVRLARNIIVPAPLADLLYSLGQFHSNANGIIYNLTQPPRADPAPAWWNIDNNIVANWQMTMGRMQNAYTMREYPTPTEYQNRPLCLTTIQDDGQLRSVRSFTNETTMADSFIRFVNDDLFNPVEHMAYADCHLRTVEGLHLQTVRTDYVRGYCTNVTM